MPALSPTPPLFSLLRWHVGVTDNGFSEVKLVLTDPDEARAWLHWLLEKQEAMPIA